MRPKIIILIDVLDSAGAENVAVKIAVNLHEAGRFDPIVCATRWGGVLERILEERGVRCVILNRQRAYHAHKFLPLHQLIRKERVELIHAHKIGSNFWGSLVGIATGVPVIAHFHGDHSERKRSGNVLGTRLVGKLCRKAVAISNHERERLIAEERLPPDKLTTIYNGINVDRYRTSPAPGIRRELNITEHAPVVGIVAAFRPQKNHHLYLDAAREVVNSRPDAVFLLAGEGELRGESEAYAREIGIFDSCRFTGHRSDVPDVISVMDVGVLSSHWEGLPLAILEYMASAKAVVSTDVSGVAEIIENEKTGFLTPPGDSRSLAERITALLEDKPLSERIGARGLAAVRDRFSETSMMARVEGLYNDILSAGRQL